MTPPSPGAVTPLAADDPCRLDATSLAQGLAAGRFSSLDIVERQIARIETVDTALNAVAIALFEDARREAREADRRRLSNEIFSPLDGVPITVKKCLDLEGTASTFGLPSRSKILPTGDNPYVSALRRAGAIILAKTNVAQLLFGYESDNPVYGRTNNPHDPARTPGGSSGGEAALIAAYASPLGIGTDIAGSVRVPASFCGIAGFKPTAGRTPDLGRHSAHPGQRAIVSQVGLLSRSARDLEFGLDIINGVADPDQIGGRSLGDPASVRIEGLRVAVLDDDGVLPASPALRRAVREAAAHLESRGAILVDWTPPNLADALHNFTRIIAGDAGKVIRAAARRDPLNSDLRTLGRLMGLPRPLLAAMQRLVSMIGASSLGEHAFLAFGHDRTIDYWDAVDRQVAFRRDFSVSLDRANGGPADIVLSPPAPLPALQHGAAREFGFMGAYSILWNLLGWPAGVVPWDSVQPGEESDRTIGRDATARAAAHVERNSVGLPVGVQVGARAWQDHVALAAMQALERPAYARTAVASASKGSVLA